jgi:hypothetical protein
MKSQTIPCVLAIIFLVGCSTTYYVPRDPGTGEFIEAKGDMEGRTGVVTDIMGGSHALDSLFFRADTVAGYDCDTHALVLLPLSQVDKVNFTSILRGIGRGVPWGLAIGGSFGLIMAATDKDPHPLFNREANIGMGVFGGVIGGMEVGIVHLSAEQYRFENEGDSKARKEPTLEELAPSQIVNLRSWPLEQETPESISILWKGKPVWLPRAKIKFERLAGGLIDLTVSKNLLEHSSEK